jgi:hypothetical protein
MEILIVIPLIILNSVFVMSETAVIWARKVRLQQWASQGNAKACNALELANSPNRFLSTVQVGITLVGVLADGVAVIRVEAATEVELKEKKHRVEDALSATRAAVEEGIVPGGGVALINAIKALGRVKNDYPDEQTAVNMLRRALEEPMRGIARNAGMDGAVVVQEVRRLQKRKKSDRIGYDVMTGEYQDMVKAGIIDPAKRNACS